MRSLRAAVFEGNGILAQLLAQGPTLLGGQARPAQAGTGPERVGPQRRGGPGIGDILAKQFGAEASTLDITHSTGPIGHCIDTDGEDHRTEEE